MVAEAFFDGIVDMGVDCRTAYEPRAVRALDLQRLRARVVGPSHGEAVHRRLAGIRSGHAILRRRGLHAFPGVRRNVVEGQHGAGRHGVLPGHEYARAEARRTGWTGDYSLSRAY